jgi:hypothetical protein
MGEEFWNEVQEHISTIQGNLGICCQDYCDASAAMHAMEELMEKLVDLKEKTK